MNGRIYPEGTVYQLLLKGGEAASVISEWWETNIQADARLRRAKTRGCVVLETQDMIFASHIVQVWGAKVNIKEPK